MRLPSLVDPAHLEPGRRCWQGEPLALRTTRGSRRSLRSVPAGCFIRLAASRIEYGTVAIGQVRLLITQPIALTRLSGMSGR